MERLIRFVDDEGNTVYGDLPPGIPIDKIEGSIVFIVNGDLDNYFCKTIEKAMVKWYSPHE